MNKTIKALALLIFSSLIITGSALADDGMKGHNMAGHDSSNRMGDLIHESTVDGHMLSYYLMDLRHQNTAGSETHDMDQMDKMDKPHHIMVYIMDTNHAPVTRATVGFLIKDGNNKAQKAMAMYMDMGFGITADMGQKGTYTITTKALIGKTKLMDKFEYEIK